MVDVVSVEFPLALRPEGVGDLVELDESLGAPKPTRRVWPSELMEHGDFASVNEEIVGRLDGLSSESRPEWLVRGAVWLELELGLLAWWPPVSIWPGVVASLAAHGVGLNLCVLPDPEGVAPDEPAESGYSGALGGDKTGSPQGLPAVWPQGLAVTIVQARDARGLVEKQSTPGYVVAHAEFEPVEVRDVRDLSSTVLTLLDSREAEPGGTGVESLLIYLLSDCPDFRVDIEVMEQLAARGMVLAFEVTPGGVHAEYVRAFNASVGAQEPHIGE